MLTKDAIFAFDDLPRQKVEIPEWKGHVYVRALNGAERDALERMVGSDGFNRATLVAFCTVDEKGERLFSDADVAKLSTKNGEALGRIVVAALSFNGMDNEALEAGKGDSEKTDG